jgi:predicted transcriptional regulator
MTIGYTQTVKTAVSIPDELYDRAERLARKLAMTRSGLFSAALNEYVARHTDDDITEPMNAALREIGDQDDPFTREAAVRVLMRTEWQSTTPRAYRPT